MSAFLCLERVTSTLSFSLIVLLNVMRYFLHEILSYIFIFCYYNVKFYSSLDKLNLKLSSFMTGTLYMFLQGQLYCCVLLIFYDKLIISPQPSGQISEHRNLLEKIYSAQ